MCIRDRVYTVLYLRVLDDVVGLQHDGEGHPQLRLEGVHGRQGAAGQDDRATALKVCKPLEQYPSLQASVGGVLAVCVCVCTCVRACVRASMHACVHLCVVCVFTFIKACVNEKVTTVKLYVHTF